MTSMKDFEDDKGNIDWNAYRKAQVDDGDICQECGSYIFFGKGYRRSCVSCQELLSKENEVVHQHFIRCPKCRHCDNVHDDYYELFEEGEHEVFCRLCDHKYTISTHVRFDFTSPPKIPEEPEEEEVEEEDEEAVDDKAEGGT